MNINWIAVLGKIEAAKGNLKHIPVVPTESLAQKQIPVSLARSNVQFETGKISFEAFLKDSDSKCQLGLNQGTPTEIYLGLNFDTAAYGIALFKSPSWETLASAGFGDKPPLNRWISIQVSVLGSKIDLFIDGVKVCTASHNIVKSQVGFLLRGTQEVVVRNLKIEGTRPRCFVVMQYTAEFNALYEEVIKPTCESFGLDVERADDSYNSGLIIEEISKSIREASVVIADVTPNNPNVFYEVGYAHGIGKPTILLSDRQREKLPFDVSGFRTLFYDNTIAGKSTVEEKLKKHLESMAE